MITHEETFCEEWEALCEADWLAAQEAMEMDTANEEMEMATANEEMLEMLESWEEYEHDTDDYGDEAENYA